MFLGVPQWEGKVRYFLYGKNAQEGIMVTFARHGRPADGVTLVIGDHRIILRE